MAKLLLFISSVFLVYGNPSERKKASVMFFSERSLHRNAPGTIISGTLTGGTNAGAFSATSVDPTCSMGLTGPKSFGNQYSVSGKADKEFSSLQLLVDDYEAAKKGTDKFYIKVAFGKRLMGKSYEVNNSDNSIAGKKQGSGGKLTVKESGSSKTVTITGKTADGVVINATIVCNAVVTMPGK
ncbi:hypothetical protein [Dyadobacter frigoris]|uniref:Uncharacterized protein n=1 Tax=Dyadobacter frigoris TaxID=2576211 RepID=A0A4U6D9T1_9BACT|nr:hypothetical protein [Dyadobacter frigoris]TKT94239.1 hypothetical protein FDK13_03230 [Dyadobacter frigoris]GLU50571.1 hypothetical protein Dfri01_00320 [Dyadobacter frigoris]